MQKTRILIVDDDKDITEVVKGALEIEGFSTDIAYDGKQALEKVAKKKPDLIILDIIMPVVDGWEVLLKLKGDPETESIPVILVTAKTEEISRITGFKQGADDYVTKPFSATVLSQRVSAVLSRVRQREFVAEAEGKKTGIKKIFLKSGNKTVMLDAEEIIYIERKKGTTIVHTADKIYPVRASLAELEEKLKEYHFFRIHKSYLANLGQAKELEKHPQSGYLLSLRDKPKIKIPVSRRQASELRKILRG